MTEKPIFQWGKKHLPMREICFPMEKTREWKFFSFWGNRISSKTKIIIRRKKKTTFQWEKLIYNEDNHLSFPFLSREPIFTEINRLSLGEKLADLKNKYLSLSVKPFSEWEKDFALKKTSFCQLGNPFADEENHL